MNPKTRRQFLRSCCQAGAVGMAAHFARLAPMPVFAQSAGDYKALVCIFLFGGNDSNNVIVPIDSRYGAYQTMRGAVALPQANLLPAGSSGYGFHPNLPNVRRFYNQSRTAVVFNVGTLFQPTTKATLGSSRLPRNLYSHSDQTQQWQTSDPNGGATGWGGRINDVAQSMNTGALPPGITVNGGSAMFLNGSTTQGLNYSNANSFGLASFGGTTATQNRVAALQNILTFDTGVQLVGAANGVLGSALRSAQEINAAVNSAPTLPVAFPGTGLGQQLAQVAQLISVAGSIGMNRQIFFCGIGGFDNHENLLPAHVNLMSSLDNALNAFITTLEMRGQLNNVTTFTESEFNRTADANSTVGTDHAWGSHMLVLGGAVNGGTHGTFPIHQLRGPDDAGDRGYWIPTTSTDQYAATFGRWFGMTDAQLGSIFPNLATFTPRTLGFL